MALSDKMMMIVAAGSYNGAAGAGAVAYGQRGGAVTRNNVGLYDITLDKDVNVSECAIIITTKGAARATHCCTHTSDTVKRVVTRTGGAVPAAVDVDFDWVVFRFAP
jgi:hypothetical protein